MVPTYWAIIASFKPLSHARLVISMVATEFRRRFNLHFILANGTYFPGINMGSLGQVNCLRATNDVRREGLKRFVQNAFQFFCRIGLEWVYRRDRIMRT
jgi:hypothetical protein